MEKRRQLRLIGSGEGIGWELLNDDVTVERIVTNRRSMESTESLQRWLQARNERGPDPGMTEGEYRVVDLR